MKTPWSMALNVIVFICVICGAIYVFSHYSTYSYLKGRTAFEDQQKLNQGIVTVSSRGVATTFFGQADISYPDHCYSSAQSYFQTVVLTTSTAWFIFALIISALMLIISFFTKFRLNLLQFIGAVIIIMLVSSFVLQQWGQSNDIYHGVSLLKVFYPVCF